MTVIQWYPGHMAKALRLLALVQDIVSGRIAAKQKKHYRFDKDGSCRSQTDERMDHILRAKRTSGNCRQQQPGHASRNRKENQGSLKGKNCGKRSTRNQEFAHQGDVHRNVGKSTLLNRLVKKNVAIVGNKPGVTKAQQWLKAGSSLLLLDTPGILWPKFEDPIVGKKLALTGAVKDTLYAKDDVALYELEYFVDNHPQALTERYKLDESDLDQPTVELLLSITKKMGFKEDYDRASERLIFECRKGKLGRFTLDAVPKDPAKV